jgi:hypothetical protein
MEWFPYYDAYIKLKAVHDGVLTLEDPGADRLYVSAPPSGLLKIFHVEIDQLDREYQKTAFSISHYASRFLHYGNLYRVW